MGVGGYVMEVPRALPVGLHLTGQVVAAYRGRERIYAFPTRDFGSSRERDFSRLNLHLPLFEQPGKDDVFSRLLAAQEWFELYHIPIGYVC